MDGWIKLHRKLKESSVFDNSDLLKVWVWCLLKASHEDYVQMVGLQEVHLKKGQFVFGRKAAAEELKMSESKTYRFVKKLEVMRNLNIKTNNKFSIVSIENWSFYQSEDGKCEQQIEQQMNNKRTTNEHKQEQKNNIYIFIDEYSENENLRQALKDFLEMRKKIKSPMTDKAVKLLLSQLDKLGGTDEDLKIALLNQSTLNNWKSIYPLKQDQQQQQPKPQTIKQFQKPTNSFHNFDGKIDKMSEADLEEIARRKREKREKFGM